MKKTSIRRDFYRFIRSPEFIPFRGGTVKDKLIIVFKVLVLTYAMLILTQIPLGVLEHFDIISKVTHKSIVGLNSDHKQMLAIRPYLFLSMVILSPIFEESAFRLFLSSFKLDYFIVSVSLIVGVGCYVFFNYLLWHPEAYFLLSIMPYLYSVLVGLCVALGLYLFKNKIGNQLGTIWNNSCGYIFYSSAVLFSIVHIQILNFETRDLAYMPFILLPFFVFGLSFGYVRIRVGLIYSILIHFIINGVVFAVNA